MNDEPEFPIPLPPTSRSTVQRRAPVSDVVALDIGTIYRIGRVGRLGDGVTELRDAAVELWPVAMGEPRRLLTRADVARECSGADAERLYGLLNREEAKRPRG